MTRRCRKQLFNMGMEHLIQQSIHVLDCGFPTNEGISFENIRDGDAIGISRKMHIACLEGYERQGSEWFVCQPNGVWKSDLKCNKIFM